MTKAQVGATASFSVGARAPSRYTFIRWTATRVVTIPWRILPYLARFAAFRIRVIFAETRGLWIATCVRETKLRTAELTIRDAPRTSPACFAILAALGDFLVLSEAVVTVAAFRGDIAFLASLDAARRVITIPRRCRTN